MEAAGGGESEWVASQLRGVLQYLEMLGCDHATAADMAQEVFLVFWRKRFAQRGPDLQRLLRRIARDLWISDRRRRARWDQGSRAWVDAVDAAWSDGHVGAWDDDALDALRRCRAELEGRARKAVEWFYERGLCRAETAERMGLKETGLKTLLQRVRARLRECVRRRAAQTEPSWSRSSRPHRTYERGDNDA